MHRLRLHRVHAKAAPALLLALAMAAGCAPTVAEPEQGLAVIITGPIGADSPFADPLAKFIALVAEGPGISTQPNAAPTQIAPFVPSGQTLVMPAVPYGPQRQIRVELYPEDANGKISFPVLSRGRTVPQDVTQGKTFLAHAYVTKTNAWAPPISDAIQEAKTDARVGVGAELMPDGSVLMAGGGSVLDPAKSPLQPAALGTFSKVVLRYDAALRVLQNLSVPPVSAELMTGRAMMATASGFDGQVVFTGGYVAGDVAPTASNLIEYWDPKAAKIKQATAGAAHLEFARAHHTVTRLYDNESYYMVCGGKGPAAEAALSWEIWHPLYGRLEKGSLSKPRWNHASVRLPEKDGGYIMLIGGENDSGPIDDFEVLRFDTAGNVSFKGNGKLTCSIGGVTHNQKDSNEVCNSLKTQPGYQPFYWEPLTRKLNGGLARTRPAAAFVSTDASNFIYIVGGFEDAAMTKPLSRVDVFDIAKGEWAGSVPTLESARGAPMLAATRGVTERGRVVVSGGIGSDGKTVAKAEVLYFDAGAGVIKREWADGDVPGGGRVLGVSLGLTTGHIVVLGGATSKDAGFVASDRIGLYNPR